MEALRWVFNIVLILCSIGMVVLVLSQKGGSDGLGAAFGGGSDNFFGKNKAKSIEARKQKWTAIMAVVVALLAIAMCLVRG